MADSLNYTDPRGMMADRYASQYTPLSGNLDQMTIQLGGNAGAMLGNALFGGQSSAMMEQRAINDAIKEADAAEDPDKRLNLFAQALRKRGLEGRAQDVESKLATRLKDRAATKKSQYEMEQDQAQYALRYNALKKRFRDISDEEAQGIASDPEAFRKTFEGQQAKVSTFGQTLIDAGLTPGSGPYKARMNQYIDKELKKKGIGAEIGEALGAAGVFDRKDVSDIVTQARQELKPFQELQQVTDNTFALFEVDNPKSGAQIDRNLARLSGDSQLSMAEVSAVANAGPFGQQVADSISRFFVGGSGDLSKQQKKDVVEALSVANVAAYNKKRNELINAYGLTGASSADLKRAVGEEAALPPKVMASFVKRSGFPYEPDKYVYRVGPNGSLQRKPKGK